MDEHEARRRCERLRATETAPGVTWLAQRTADDRWAVVRVRAEGLAVRRDGVAASVDGVGVRPAPPLDRPREPNPYWGM